MDLITLIQSLASGMSFVFPLWPLIIILPLQRGKNVLPNMIRAWGIVAVIWIPVRLFAVPFNSYFIPEPLNTILFFLTGAGLLLYRNREQIQLRNYLRMRGDTASSPKDLFDLPPNNFENMVVELFTARGHKANKTGAIGDHGVDVVVQAKNGEKWVAQCKRWRGNVGEPVIRDFYGVMHHEKADRGMIITTGTFTPQAREWAKGKPLDLIEGHQFLEYWKKARASTKTK